MVKKKKKKKKERKKKKTGYSIMYYRALDVKDQWAEGGGCQLRNWKSSLKKSYLYDLEI